MNFGQAIVSGFRNYIGYTGRACRSEYWYWVLFMFLGNIVALILDSMLFPSAAPTPGGAMDPASQLSPISGLFSLLILVPAIMMQIRRLHDINRSGWWWLIGFVPIIGTIILIVWAIQRGTAGDNRFGPDPLAGAAAQPI